MTKQTSTKPKTSPAVKKAAPKAATSPAPKAVKKTAPAKKAAAKKAAPTKKTAPAKKTAPVKKVTTKKAAPAKKALPVRIDPPAPMDPARRERLDKIVALRESGVSLSKIGKQLGNITGEAVRQLLLSVKDAPTSADASETRAARRQTARRDGIINLAKQHPAMSVSDIAEERRVTVHEVRTVLGKAAWVRPLGAYSTQYSKDAAAAAEKAINRMRELVTMKSHKAETANGLSAPYYDKHRKGAVTSQRVAVYYGSWTKACQVAGVDPLVVASTGAVRATWSDEQLWDITNTYVRQAEYPTFTDMQAWLAADPSYPTMHLLRRRLGPWSTIQQHFHDHPEGFPLPKGSPTR